MTDKEDLRSACVCIGCFGFYTGLPSKELVYNKPKGLYLMVPENAHWETVIEDVYPDANKVTRYALEKIMILIWNV